MTEITLSLDKGRAREMVLESIKSGASLEKLKEWIGRQGGDASFITNPSKLLECNYKKEYLAKTEGYISHIQADSVGKASMLLGAGRAKLGDEIDFTAGICLCKSFGEYVKVGDTVAILHSATNDFSSCESELDSAITISREKPLDQPLIFAII
jgi:thymidine phosphorylase